MNRREAIERVALLTGGAIIGADFFLSGCKRNPKQVNTLFNEDHVAFLNEVGDTVLPDTKTPGAKAANVGGFMAIMVMDCYTPEDQQLFMAGLPKIDKESQKMFAKNFLDCDPKQRTQLITMLDREQKKELKQPKPGSNYRYFTMIKQLTLLGYFTSEIGCTKALRYIEVPGRFDGNLPYKKGDHAWAILSKTMKLRLGMIGGGEGAFIGAVHRIAARIDNDYELVCGAFSSNPEKSKASGVLLGLAASRVYPSYQELIEKEKQLPEDERVQVISIVTPNHVHFAPAKMALENGFNVILDKPMTFSLAEAKELDKIVEASGKRFCLTHTYTGYPMVKEAKQLIKAGKFGTVRKIYVEYPQGWLSTFLEGADNKQASWRTDPGKSGIAGSMGDIGTHAFNLAEYISGLQVNKLSADINIVVKGRKLDDDGAVLLKFNNGASGVLMASQIAAGAENNIKIRIYGETGGLEWQQDCANTLLVTSLDKPAEIWRTGGGYVSSFASHNTRTPAGHPEGYLEAFANLYHNFALCVKADIEGKQPEPEWLDYPDVKDGVRGMAFIENVIASGKSDKKWTDFTV